jgi:fructokinase
VYGEIDKGIGKDFIPMKKILVGIGEILWDLLPSGKQLGGAPANFASHASLLGEEGIVVSCIGNDDLGKEILIQLDSMCLNRDFITIDPVKPTGTVQVILDPHGIPTFTIQEDVAWDYIPQTGQLPDLARSADVVCFGCLAQRSAVSRETIMSFLDGTSPHALRIFDVNLRQSFYSQEMINHSIRLANILKLNENELPVVAGLLGLEGDVNTLLLCLSERYDLEVIALTRGSNGSVLFSGGRVSLHKGIPVEVVDTVGAGDAFTAAMAIGLLRDDDLDTINEFANQVASFVCTQSGAISKIPERIKNRF